MLWICSISVMARKKLNGDDILEDWIFFNPNLINFMLGLNVSHIILKLSYRENTGWMVCTIKVELECIVSLITTQPIHCLKFYIF